MAAGPIGIIANPASGKDIRRLVAHASVFDNQEKASIVRRMVLGAIAAGANHFVFMSGRYRIVELALDGIDSPGTEFTALESPDTGSALDTIRAAAELRDAGCSVVITLGGDGTNRAVASAWRDVPVVPISTGTNNVFPRMVEATVAGTAAGLVSSGQLTLDEVAQQVKTVHVAIEGAADDLALIDAVLLRERFVGARAIWDPSSLMAALLTRAEPASVGISSIGGLLHPVSDADDHGLLLEFGASGGATESGVFAPIAPGLFREIPVSLHRTVALGEAVEWHGPGLLAFDGERERPLKPGQAVQVTVRRDGPRVVDTTRALKLAACRGLFRYTDPEEA